MLDNIVIMYFEIHLYTKMIGKYSTKSISFCNFFLIKLKIWIIFLF